MYKITNGDFYFIQTEPMTEERKKLGWEIDLSQIPYCICSYKDSESFERSMQLINNCDALIIGSAVNSFIKERISRNKLSFFYAESFFKKGFWHVIIPTTFVDLLKRFILPSRQSNVYMLCASAFTAIDTYRIHAFRGKCFKWGHFVDIDTSMKFDAIVEKKKASDKVSILWAGRLLELKHPEYAVKVARTLYIKGIPFELKIIGNGPMDGYVRKLIRKYKLEDYVKMLGAMTPQDVRRYMEESDIFLFTSGRIEGWGAVLSESMASGCAVIADSAIGSAPFLVEHMKNGMLYKTGSYKSFENKVIYLSENKDFRNSLGSAAFASIRENWTPQEAVRRLYKLIESLLNNAPITLYKTGPISNAPLIQRDWFRD
jgi:glycosyltransferase involved in cell wall biosynthesis